jgi:hypothetical protein
MNPTLIDIDHAPARMMDRGMFQFFHAWDCGNGDTVEYWRGLDDNGACIRELHDGTPIRTTHHRHAGNALTYLKGNGFPIPGVYA